MKKKILISLLLTGCCLLSGCSQSAGGESPSAAPPESSAPSGGGDLGQDAGESLYIEDQLVPQSGLPSGALMPVASGTAVETGGGAEIDYSNIEDGYVMARFAGRSGKRLLVQVAGPETTYTYDLPTGSWVTFPLSDGDGSYQATVLRNTTEKKYVALASAAFDVALSDESAPFLRPNQYVDYGSAANSVAQAAQLCQGLEDPQEKVEAIYQFVVGGLTYDHDKADQVSSGALSSYLPDLDDVLASQTGICLDYAALMAGMLRSQGVPCKLVVGYVGEAYHAWVSVWTADDGWVEGASFSNGGSWQRMDPTFAASGNAQLVLGASDYQVKYLY